MLLQPQNLPNPPLQTPPPLLLHNLSNLDRRLVNRPLNYPFFHVFPEGPGPISRVRKVPRSEIGAIVSLQSAYKSRIFLEVGRVDEVFGREVEVPEPDVAPLMAVVGGKVFGEAVCLRGEAGEVAMEFSRQQHHVGQWRCETYILPSCKSQMRSLRSFLSNTTQAAWISLKALRKA